jgi:nucleoside-diphosphate-sugar epimerase
MSDKLVLVTGPSGYVGAHVFQTLLQKGYRVRGTVRSEEKANQLKEDFAKYKSQIESFVIVQDIIKDGAFEDAVKGVDYVIHVASPFHFNIEDNKRDMLDPAVKGTNNVLTAAKKEKQIKRVVITSSFASILDLNKGDRPGYTYNEEDWNPVTWDEACNSDNPTAVYCASKKFAELAGFKFVEEQKPSFDIATMCKSYDSKRTG